MPYPVTATQRETCAAQITFAYSDGATLDRDIYPSLLVAVRNLHHYRPYGGHTPVAREISPVCNHGNLPGECAVAELTTVPDRTVWCGYRVVPLSVCCHHPDAER